jgi:hypothetical protein
MFWGNSSHSSVIFKMQKRVIRIIMGCGYRESCRELFKELKILTHSSQYIFSLLLFVVNNRDYFVSNSVHYNINMRQKNDLHFPQVSEGRLLFRHGYDEIPLKILEISLPFIISPLTYICNKSLSTGTFPTRLKYSQINPIFKKGNKAGMSNYRPISLLTAFTKVFEKVIYKRLHYHIKSNNTLAKEQYGFMNNSSTEIASYNLINDILKALNSKMWVGGIFCDLNKACDCKS